MHPPGDRSSAGCAHTPPMCTWIEASDGVAPRDRQGMGPVSGSPHQVEVVVGPQGGQSHARSGVLTRSPYRTLTLGPYRTLTSSTYLLSADARPLPDTDVFYPPDADVLYLSDMSVRPTDTTKTVRVPASIFGTILPP